MPKEDDDVWQMLLDAPDSPPPESVADQVERWSGQRPKAKRAKPTVQAKDRARYAAESEAMRTARQWDHAEPGHIVALYRWCLLGSPLSGNYLWGLLPLVLLLISGLFYFRRVEGSMADLI